MTFVFASAIGATAGWLIEQRFGDPLRRWGLAQLDRLFNLRW
jgi:hypothetical protein